jgi:hypothetical protein
MAAYLYLYLPGALLGNIACAFETGYKYFLTTDDQVIKKTMDSTHAMQHFN